MVYDQAIFDAICNRIADGESLRSVCRDETMPSKANFFRWVAANKEAADQYARAMEVRSDVLFDELLDIADTPQMGEIVTHKGDGTLETRQEDMLGHRRLQVDARKWALAKMQPKKYGDKLELGGQGPNGEIVFQTVYESKP
jgi:hypothetical protein